MLASPRLKTSVAFIILAVILHEHAWYIFLGLDNFICDLHGFRQTQTALTAYYFSQTGFRFDYLTPVLGSPWSIPFEFPTYQWMAHLVHDLFEIKLDVAGRLVSITSFYLALGAAFLIFRELSYSRAERFVLLSFVLINPILIFWSRTFMIEITTVFICLIYLLCVLRAIALYESGTKLNMVWLTAIFLSGGLAAVSKVTTFLVYISCAFLFFAVAWVRLYGKKIAMEKLLKDGATISIVAFAVPILIVAGWTRFTDNVKQQSFLGSTVTSSTIDNFGSMDQKLSWNVWLHIDDNSCHYLVIVLGIVLVSFLFSLRHRVHIALFTLSGLAGPVLFTTLYFIHDYYSTANMMLYSFAIGLFVLSIWEKRKQVVVFSVGILATLSILQISRVTYMERYYGHQANNHRSMYEIGSEIKRLTRDGDVLLVIGRDWSSEVPYYSERKSVCVPTYMMSQFNSDPDLFLKKLEGSMINTLVTFSESGALQAGSLEMNIVQHYGLDEKPHPVFSGYAHVFLSKGR